MEALESIVTFRESGEQSGKNRTARLMRKALIKVGRAYRKPSYINSKPSIAAYNRLELTTL